MCLNRAGDSQNWDQIKSDLQTTRNTSFYPSHHTNILFIYLFLQIPNA